MTTATTVGPIGGPAFGMVGDHSEAHKKQPGRVKRKSKRRI